MWTFNIGAGAIADPGGRILTEAAYSGHGAGLDAAALDGEADVGPIPTGQWSFGTAFDHPRLGPCVMHLTPAPGTDARGRSGFFIHGDNARADRSASHGCIVADHATRLAMAESADRRILVAP